jgi:tripartite-type tricarboxylate transporter receptor subunit TctC
VVVQNLPGAGSLVATVTLANTAARDGTVLGVVGGGTALEPVLGNPQARYDARQFAWIGGKSGDHFMCAISSGVPAKDIAGAREREIVVGSTGTGSRTMSYPIALNSLVGTKFKVVSGYPGGNEISMALEKGEVEGYCGWAISSIRQRSSDWITQGKIRFLTQFALSKHKDFPDLPLAMDLPETEVGRRAIEFISSDSINAWPLIAPPGLPKERIELLRTAFEAMLRDPAAVAEAQREGMDLDPISGRDLERVIERLYSAPPDVVSMVRKINESR